LRYERHAFISYAHIDNQPLPTEQDGWVTLFHEALEQLLAGRLGGTAKVWRDHKLRGNDVFASEIVGQFLTTAALVSILTPRYLKSEWCTKEIGEFCDAAEKTGGVVVDNKSRVFKVLKLPIDEQPAALPPALSQVLGYEFYELDADQTPRELDPAYGEKSKQDFLRKVAKLAWDIKLLLDRLSADAVSAGTDKPVVYLAECSRDRREAREMLEGELTRLGYVVLPDAPLPTDEREYVAEVERLLARCRFAIHLIGGTYGLVPDGPSQKSVVVLQNEIAAKATQAAALKRVIWVPEGTQSDQSAQAAFIAALHSDAAMQLGADLVTGDLETLKGAIHAALKKIERPEPERRPAPAAVSTARHRIHLLCDARDRKEAIALIKHLRDAAEVSLPIFAGDAAQVREANQSLLMACDAVILYYGAGDEAWKFHQQNELRRIRALRTDDPLPPETVYLSGATSDDKDLLVALGEPTVVDGRNGLPEAALAAALAAVRLPARS
jgi:hypothetical protein